MKIFSHLGALQLLQTKELLIHLKQVVQIEDLPLCGTKKFFLPSKKKVLPGNSELACFFENGFLLII
jgi:hypothetical protein